MNKAWEKMAGPREMAGLAVALLFLACVTLPLGCASDNSPRGAAGSPKDQNGPPIERLTILTTPVALGGNSGAGINGIAAKIFAASTGDKKTRPIRVGNLEFLLFDGILKEFPPEGVGGRHIWTFTPQDLEPLKISTAIGTAYLFALAWGDDVPAGDMVTLFARYHPLKGPPVYSPPSYVPFNR